MPDDCMVDFDLRLIDLFDEMDKKSLKLKDKIVAEYKRVKDYLGKRPTRMELFTYMDDDVYQMAITHAKENPFKRYMDYQKEMGDLSVDELKLFDGRGGIISFLEGIL